MQKKKSVVKNCCKSSTTVLTEKYGSSQPRTKIRNLHRIYRGKEPRHFHKDKNSVLLLLNIWLQVLQVILTADNFSFCRSTIGVHLPPTSESKNAQMQLVGKPLGQPLLWEANAVNTLKYGIVNLLGGFLFPSLFFHLALCLFVCLFFFYQRASLY